VYSFLNARSESFVRRHIESKGGTVTDRLAYAFPIRHMFPFHREELRRVDVVLYRVKTAKGYIPRSPVRPERRGEPSEWNRRWSSRGTRLRSRRSLSPARGRTNGTAWCSRRRPAFSCWIRRTESPGCGRSTRRPSSRSGTSSTES